MTLTRRAKSMLLTALAACVVIAGLLVGPDLISGVTYSRFKPVYLSLAFGGGTRIIDRQIPGSHWRKLKRTFAQYDVPFKEQDGVLYVRNREWWDKELMAHITHQADLPVETDGIEHQNEIELVALYPKRSILAKTALIRERSAEDRINRLKCVFNHYGLDSSPGPDLILVPEKILHHAAFLRFAAAKANDSEWINGMWSRNLYCRASSRELSFSGDGEAAPGQPWPQYSADELVEILSEFGFFRLYYRGFPDAPLRVSQGLYDEPEVLTLLVGGDID